MGYRLRHACCKVPRERQRDKNLHERVDQSVNTMGLQHRARGDHSKTTLNYVSACTCGRGRGTLLFGVITFNIPKINKKTKFMVESKLEVTDVLDELLIELRVIICASRVAY